MRLKITVLAVLLLLALTVSMVTAETPQQETNDQAIVDALNAANAQLAAQGLNIRATEMHAFTIPGARALSGRILQQAFRWVPGDPLREADGTNLTYIVDESGGATDDGLTAADTSGAIDRSFQTWDTTQCGRKVNLVKRADPGTDITIYDSFFGFGGFGNYLAADIVNAGWYPKAFFDVTTGGAGDRVLAFSVTFTWVNDDGTPADVNGDGYVDTALNEVYYNDFFAWGINVDRFDVQTVALHENGHSLGLGHFVPPPDAVMNPIYAGIRHEPYGTDNAGMCTIFGRWPNR